MPINTPTGYLDITNATLRGSKIVTTGFVGIANANPTNHLSIGSNLHINDTHSNVLQISGNINAASVVLGGISIAPTFDLEVITNTGNTTPNTLEFNNAATAFVTTANATIGDTLTASKLVGDGSGISAIQSSNVTDFGSNVSRITALESGDTSISGDKTFTGDVVFESNVHMNGGNVFVANTVNLTVSDPIIELGSNNSGTNDLGIIMTRPNNNSNVAVVFDESDDILRMGYTLNGANDTIIDLDSNALAVSVQGALTVGSNLEVGTANLFVDTTSGNVGIGTNNPDVKLHVNGATSATHVSLGTTKYPTLGGNWLTIISPTFDGDLGDNHPDPDGGILFTNYSSNGSLPWGYYMGVVKDVAGTTGTTQRFDIGKSYDLNSQSSSGHADTLTPYLTIDNGNVGIGTASPLQTLNVKGDGENPVIYMTDGTNNRYASGMGTHNVTSVGQRLDFYNGDSGANGTSLSSSHIRMSIDASGKVGIGTSSPRWGFEVTPPAGLGGVLSCSNDPIFSHNLYYSGGWKYGSASTGGAYIRMIDSEVQFWNAPNSGSGTWDTAGGTATTTQRMTIDESGNVGIGTTGPSHNFEVYGSSASFNVDVSDSNGPIVGNQRASGDFLSLISLGSVNICCDANDNSTGKTIDFRTNSYSNGGTLLMRINDNGTVQFGSDGLLHINSRTTTYGSETVALQTTIDGRALTESNPGTHGSESRNVLALQPDGGYVGVGVSNPAAKLHVETTGSADVARFFRPNATTGSPTTIHLGRNAATNDTAQFRYVYGGSTNNSSSRIDLGFYGNGSILNITAGGKVGIGNSNPTNQKLEIHSGGLYINKSGTQSTSRNLNVNKWILLRKYGNRVANEGPGISFQGSYYPTADYNNHLGMIKCIPNPDNSYDLKARMQFYVNDGGGSSLAPDDIAGYFDHDSNGNQVNFTGQHRTFIKDIPTTQSELFEGLIVSANQNKYVKMNGGIEAGSNAVTINESLPIVSLSNVASDKKCFGVISYPENSETREDRYGRLVCRFKKEPGDTRVYINSAGEGAIWVTNSNGPLESGDYITTSNVAGYGMLQDDDILHNYTVAKITMDCDFSPATQPVQIIKKELGNVNYWVETTYTDVALEEYSNLAEENRQTVTTTRYSNGDGDISPSEYSNLESNVQATYSEIETVTYQHIEREESTTEQEGYTPEVREELVNVLDENGQLQWEDHPTDTENAYKIRYLTADGTQTDEANAVHVAAFVGCTYHCG